MTTIDWPAAPFTWRQFEQSGGTREQIRQGITSLQIRRVLKGVYQSTEVDDSLTQRCAALALVMRPYDVVSDRTAAWVHGVDALQFRELDMVPPIECVVFPDRSRSRHRACAGGERELIERDVVSLHGILVTTALRTALDLGCRPSAATALGIVDQFMSTCGVTRPQLVSELPRFRGRRGVIQLRMIVQLASPLSESPGESWTRMAIIQHGFPPPILQYWVCVGGEPVYRVDLAYPHARVAVEFDGQDFHDSPEQQRHDDERRAWLRDRGWTVIVVRADDLSRERAEIWLAELGNALAGRA